MNITDKEGREERNLHPRIGTELASLLATKVGRWKREMMNMSKTEAWGLATMIGASAAVAGFPRTLIQWKPHPNSSRRSTRVPISLTRNLAEPQGGETVKQAEGF